MKEKTVSNDSAEDIVLKEMLSSEGYKKMVDKDLKRIIGDKLKEAGYNENDWSIHYAIERIFKSVRKAWLGGKSPNKKLAITSLVLGIIGGYMSTLSIGAIVCGHIALYKIKKDPIVYRGKGIAIAGLILGYIGLVIGVVLGIMEGLVKAKLDY